MANGKESTLRLNACGAMNSSPPPSLRNPSSYGSLKIPFRQKLKELTALFALSANDALHGESFDGLFEEIGEYDELLQNYGDAALERARVLEIGCGQRTNRLIILSSLGVDARGIDMDAPLLEGSPAELIKILRTNGFERFVRSAVRHYLFDSLHFRRLARALADRGAGLRIDPERMETRDVLDLDVPQNSLDLVISEDVFEHVEPESLRKLIRRMSTWLKPVGLALIRPNIFTGIQGNHLSEWFSLEKERKRISEPWEQLSKRRFQPRVYLNQLSRRQYREMFSEAFDILEERVKQPDLGREYLTGAVADELKNYPEEELFSNRVLFVLRPTPKGSEETARRD